MILRNKTSHSPTQSSAFALEALQEVRAKFCEPMLAELTGALPEADDWQYEIKLDGYRAIAVRHDGGAVSGCQPHVALDNHCRVLEKTLRHSSFTNNAG